MITEGRVFLDLRQSPPEPEHQNANKGDAQYIAHSLQPENAWVCTTAAKVRRYLGCRLDDRSVWLTPLNQTVTSVNKVINRF